MQIAEAYGLATWVEEEIVGRQVTAKYQALFKKLNHNATRPQNQPMQTFEDERVDLLETVQSVPLTQLSLAQLEGLSIIEIRESVGSEAADQITELLTNNQDIALIAQTINEMKGSLDRGIGKAGELRKTLEVFVQETEDLPPGSVLTRVVFEHEASIDDVEELKKWSAKLFDIGRGFAIAQGLTPQDIRVVGADKGSIIVELAILATAAIPIATAVNLVLGGMIKYRDFQLKSAEVRRMKEDNPEIANELEEDAVRWENRAERLKDEIVEDVALKVQESIDDFREGTEAELRNAVKRLVDLQAKGGTIDCVIPDEDAQSEEDENGDMEEARNYLRQTFAQVRDMGEVPRLEHFALGDDENENENENENEED